MAQSSLALDDQTYVLTHLELYNWGGFQGRHQAAIDNAGTAVIGPTGSGKTTLVDALMTLLCANPRYNLASTGGHESDRDLVSYVRGVSGPGDGGSEQAHIARSGKTVTAIAATLENGEQQVRLAALLWFDDSSSAATDMKRLWLFALSPELTLDYWLTLHHEGGMRALRQMEKETTGIWTYPSKKDYLARLRDYFAVGENAFTLLNRAAGLKQLNSIDEIFRELVLDDHSAFTRAAEVAASFDDLTEIHQELEIARKQQRSLQPIATGFQRYQGMSSQLAEKEKLTAIIPVWFAEQAYGLWRQEVSRLSDAHENAEHKQESLNKDMQRQRQRVDELQQLYLQSGGANINELSARIEDCQRRAGNTQRDALQYQTWASELGLQDILNVDALVANQQEVKMRLEVLKEGFDVAQEEAYRLGAEKNTADTEWSALRKEHAEVSKRPGSNLQSEFAAFRSLLAEELSLQEEDLPFVAELVQVKPDQQRWRGAIERAIGSHRLRILVPPESVQAALQWVNRRDNRLHVRLLEVKPVDSQPRFFDDGYTRKLDYKPHRYRDALKALLAENDRHCVSTAEQLRGTPHAMTEQGLMSGKAHFFDKQDQKRLDADWCTGFDNKDRLASLEVDIQSAADKLVLAVQGLEQAKGVVATLQVQAGYINKLLEVRFESIDLPGVQRELSELRQRLEELTRPDSDLANAKTVMDAARAQAEAVEVQHGDAMILASGLRKDLNRAENDKRKAYLRCEIGMTDYDRELAYTQLPEVSAEQLENIADIEREWSRRIQDDASVLGDKVGNLANDLIKWMSDAKKEDTGALSEVGRELEDISRYLERLELLTEEALPEKLKSFLGYLNRSSDEGVTQLLSHIDNEVATIEERLDDLNSTMRRVDFQPDHYLRLVAKKVIHESVRTLQKAQRALNSARLHDDEGESHYKALRELVFLLKDAVERNRTQGARALLDPRFRLEFAVSVIDRGSGKTLETRTGSQGGSGGEKEIIASYVLTASLSYALCPDGSSRPLFGTIVLDEAFSRSSQAVAGRIIAALREFGLHAIFITPNKEMRLLRHHTRSAIVVHRLGAASSLTSLSWEELDDHYQQRIKERHEVTE